LHCDKSAIIGTKQATSFIMGSMSYVIAICGGFSSGKSLLASSLHKSFPHSVLFPYDAYNKDQSALSPQERDEINYDVPSAYDEDLYLKDLVRLKSGQDVELPLFDYPTHTRKKETLHLKSEPLIITEGFLLFALEDKDHYFDYTIYVDATEEVRLARRLQRDVGERGYPRKQIERQFYEDVKPMHEKYIECHKGEADFLFTNNGKGGLDRAQYDQLVREIRKHLSD
jgi:uridine kinase